MEDAARRSVHGVPVALEVEHQGLAPQPLDDHRRHVAAAVRADVDDQGLLAHLAVVPLDPLPDAARRHVGDVEVADPAASEFLDDPAAPFGPGQVDQGVFARDRIDEDVPRLAAVGARTDGQLQGSPPGLAQELERVRVRGQLAALDREQVVALADADADLGQRRAVAGFLVLAFEDAGEPVAAGVLVQFEAGPEQGGARPVGRLVVAARDVGVGDVQLGDHLAHHVVQVAAVADVGEQRAVLLPERLPVVAVHVRGVEEVAEAPPDLVEDLRPLLGRHPVDGQAG